MIEKFNEKENWFKNKLSKKAKLARIFDLNKLIDSVNSLFTTSDSRITALETAEPVSEYTYIEVPVSSAEISTTLGVGNISLLPLLPPGQYYDYQKVIIECKDGPSFASQTITFNTSFTAVGGEQVSVLIGGILVASYTCESFDAYAEVRNGLNTELTNAGYTLAIEGGISEILRVYAIEPGTVSNSITFSVTVIGLAPTDVVADGTTFENGANSGGPDYTYGSIGFIYLFDGADRAVVTRNLVNSPKGFTILNLDSGVYNDDVNINYQTILDSDSSELSMYSDLTYSGGTHSLLAKIWYKVKTFGTEL